MKLVEIMISLRREPVFDLPLLEVVSGQNRNTLRVQPPLGWQTEQHIQRSDFGLAALVSYDLPSLFSGKLHALCCRNHTKGRDWYDLVWYLTHQPPVEPNLELLTQAVAQTEGAAAWEGEVWRSRLFARLEQLDFAVVKKDIAPFIERKEDLDLFSVETLGKMILG